MNGESLAVDVGIMTDVGRSRKNNEDSVKTYHSSQYDLKGGRLFTVADGVGGESYGERASKWAVDHIGDYYYAYTQRNPGVKPGDVLKQVMEIVNREIFDEAQKTLGDRQMATTAVAALLHKRELTVAWVGDSRAYIISGKDGIPRQITKDHTQIEEQLRNRLITPDEAENHPQRNVLSRSLGGDYEVDPEVVEVIVENGDVILLCSDGLTRHVDDSEIADYIHRTRDAQECADQLVMLANERGGKDNISVIVVSIGKRGNRIDEIATRVPVEAAARWNQQRVPMSRLNRKSLLVGGAVMGFIVILAAVILMISSTNSANRNAATQAAAQTEAVPVGQTGTTVALAGTQTVDTWQIQSVATATAQFWGTQTAQTQAQQAIADITQTQQVIAATQTSLAVNLTATAAMQTQTAASATANAAAVETIMAQDAINNSSSGSTNSQPKWPENQILYVNRDTPLYSSADRTNPSPTNLMRGAKVTVVINVHDNESYVTGWYHVQPSSGSVGPGWIPVEYLEENTLEQAQLWSTGEAVIVTKDEGVWLRETPNSTSASTYKNPDTSEPISILRDTRALVVDGPQSDGQWWWKISVADQNGDGSPEEGWVEQASLTKAG